MHKNIFVIGNGFDLDIGLKTRYSDFAYSSFWPKQDGNDIPNLKLYLDKEKDTESWFDIEDSLLKYARKDSEKNQLQDKSVFNPEIDMAYFVNVQNSLCDYIKWQQSQNLKHTSIAERVLRAVLENGYFDSIYSFNYTDLCAFAKKLNIREDIKYTHIHGSE